MNNGNLVFGVYVRKQRELLGKTLRGFAAEIGISPAYLSDIENGNRRAPEKFLDCFAAALELRAADELHHFYDLAGVSMNGQHTDINVYMDRVPTARVALREAKDANFTDEDWRKLIELIKREKNKEQ